jgi:hypothetical protein
MDASLDADEQARFWGISGFSVINLWLIGSLKWNAVLTCVLDGSIVAQARTLTANKSS